jgi:uncharacterized OB-fold protein
MSEAAAAPSKPYPEPDEASRPFFDGALAGKFMLMRCRSCGVARMPSRMHCDNCLSTDTEWFEASGRGTVRTFGVMHQKYHPAFYADLPYNLAIVELDEGPRLPTNIVGVANADLRVGMAVKVEWQRYEDGAVPLFRPV